MSKTVLVLITAALLSACAKSGSSSTSAAPSCNPLSGTYKLNVSNDQAGVMTFENGVYSSTFYTLKNDKFYKSSGLGIYEFDSECKVVTLKLQKAVCSSSGGDIKYLIGKDGNFTTLSTSIVSLYISPTTIGIEMPGVIDDQECKFGEI